MNDFVPIFRIGDLHFITQIGNLGVSRYEGLNLQIHHDRAVGVYWRGTFGLTRGYVVSVPAGFYNGLEGYPPKPCVNCVNQYVVPGVNFNSAGLGLSTIAAGGFQSGTTITATETAINTAIGNVRAKTETFGTNSSTIQTRQDFEKNMINTLQTGASNLVLADQNQESANLLTLQTQQQLEISARRSPTRRINPCSNCSRKFWSRPAKYLLAGLQRRRGRKSRRCFFQAGSLRRLPLNE